MRFYIFKSETRAGLCAFAADRMGEALPKHHGPWTVTGVVAPDGAPPHRISRTVIEEAIGTQGFQLWRIAKKVDAAKAETKKARPKKVDAVKADAAKADATA